MPVSTRRGAKAAAEDQPPIDPPPPDITTPAEPQTSAKRRRATTTGSSRPPPKIARAETNDDTSASASASASFTPDVPDFSEHSTPSDEELLNPGPIHVPPGRQLRYQRNSKQAHIVKELGIDRHSQDELSANAARKRNAIEDKRREVERAAAQEIVKKQSAIESVGKLLEEKRREQEAELTELGKDGYIPRPAQPIPGGVDDHDNDLYASDASFDPLAQLPTESEAHFTHSEDDIESDSSDTEYKEDLEVEMEEEGGAGRRRVRGRDAMAEVEDMYGEGPKPVNKKRIEAEETLAKARAKHKVSGDKRKLPPELANGIVNSTTTTGKKNPQDGLLPNWQENVSTLTPSFLKSASKQRRQRGSDDDDIGGFNDPDTVQSGKFKVKHAKAKGVRNLVEVDALDSNDSDGNDSPSAPRKKIVPAKTKARSRNSQASRTREDIQDWAKPYCDKLWTPTVIEFLGTQSDPWLLDDAKNPVLGDILKRVVDKTCPEQHWDPTKRDAIYGRVQQAVYTWRSGFHKHINHYLSKKIKSLKLTPQRAAKWVAEMTRKDGAAFWRVPRTESKGPSGRLETEFVQFAFGHHLESISGSVLAQIRGIGPIVNPPLGALALASCATQLSFSKFTTGALVQGQPFSRPNMLPVWPPHQYNAERVCGDQERLARYKADARDVWYSIRRRQTTTGSSVMEPISVDASDPISGPEDFSESEEE
ncbi:hypothetical protein EIP91_012079 [Steccherinum ochraceum]|uniref:Uncharacterized protein n=1 Tax=Steccherinum ochraceum TaxID=92696 RepID=A0A4R0RQT7_9APHY|nr:hypothetical protein EIP91_012079 [Steccherinum ochraceum]